MNKQTNKRLNSMWRAGRCRRPWEIQ